MNNGTHNLSDAQEQTDFQKDTLIQKLRTENQEMKEKLWVDSNLTRFDDVLRSNYDKPLTTFADEVIFHLAKLTSALRGTFFSIDQHTNLIEAIAGYACTVATLEKKQFHIGEGLIGQSIKGKETIVLDNIPGQSIVLQSSMGQLSGHCVVVMPLIFNEEVYGAVELLYLQSIENKYLDLLKRLSQNIASMLNSIQNNVRTRQLLKESKDLENELRTQEEELRQNMEELSATQEKMQKKEEELSSNINAINQTICTVEFDMEGRIMQANRLFLDLVGYSTDEVLGKHHRMFLTTSQAQSAEYKDFWEELRNGKTQTTEFKRVGNQGKEIWWRASYTPVKGIDGLPYKIMKFAVDITKEKKLRLDLTNQLSAIDRSSAMIEFDTNGHILNANKLFLQIMGYTLEQIKGKHHRIFMSEAERESQAYQQFWQQLKNGNFIEKEFKRYTQNGEQIWLKATYNPIADAQGKVYKIVKFASDITRQKRLDLDLKNQLVAINNTNAVVEFDLNGNIIKPNALFLDLVGYGQEEIEGKHHQIFVEPAYAQSKEYAHFWHQLRNGQHLEGEFARIHKNGKTIWIKGNYNPILDDEGKVYKVVKYALDITERKILEMENAQQLEKMKAAEEELRQNMEELTSTQEELQKQFKVSEANNKVMDAVLNTALDVIITMNEQGIIQSVNPSIQTLLGYVPEEVIGQNIKMLMPDQYAQAHDGYLQHYRDTGQKKIIGIGRKVEAQHKDGTVFDAHISVSEVIIEENRLFTGFIRKLD